MPNGSPIPVIQLQGDASQIGEAIGCSMRSQILKATQETGEALARSGMGPGDLGTANGPYIEKARAAFPWLLRLLHRMAAASSASFDLLFYLNAGYYRPTAPSEAAANDPSAIGSKDDSRASLTLDGCTTVVSRGTGGCVLGHTEDATPAALDDLYLLDATMLRETQAGPVATRFIGLNYAYTLPGCAATMNGYGVVLLVDALPDPEPGVAVPRDFLTCFLLESRSVDDALRRIRSIPQSGGWSCVLAQDNRVAAVEVTSSRIVVEDLSSAGSWVHTNHFLDRDLADSAPPPRPDSVARLERARVIAQPGMTSTEMKGLLSDRANYPNSICRGRTIGAFVADTADGSVFAHWGEPGSGAWQKFRIAHS